MVVRVTDVETDRFTMYLAEPSNLNGLHHAEEMVTYVVLEAGSHELANGTRLEVGKVNTTATVGGIVANQWESIRFNMAFLSNPVLLSQVQTAGGQVYLATRQTNITTTGFQIALQQEESISTQHPMETIGYLAMEASKGEWSGMAYEAKNTANTVTDVTTTYGFDSHFVAPPQLLSSLTSYYGSDNAHVRYANLNGTNVQWRIGEDTTRDTETVHVAESVAYLAIAGTGSLRTMVSQQEIGEWRQVNNLTHLPQTILLSRPYVHPVVFAQSASSNGDDPVAVRVTDVKTDRFTTYLAEPSNLNGLHNAEESITYMVLEAGRHELVDGNRLEVGTVQTGATVGLIVANQWETVHFGETFVTAPVVLSQTQTAAGEAFLTTRQTNVTSTGFQVAVQQEEMINMQHPIETIGYLAIEARTGVWSGMVYETKNTTPAVTDSFTTHYFDHGFPTAPGLLSSLTSYHGADNAHVRYTNLNPTSVQLKAGEDTTRDTETTHSAESVAYLAIGSNEPSSTLKLLSANATPPQVIGVTKNGNFNSHDTLETLTFHFNHNILVQADNLTLFNENLGVAPVDLTGLSLSINRSQATATWDFTNIHRIEPGFYTAVLAANSITNFPGTPLDGDGNGTGRDDYLHHFLIAQRGDINWDGKIDISDFHGVRTNLDPGGNTTLHDWNHGNFDRDEDVDFSDLLRTVLNFSPQGYGTSSSPTTLMNLLTHNKKHTLETTDVPATEASGHQWSSWRYHHAGLPSPGPTPPPLDNSVVDDDFGRHVALPSGRNRLVIRFMDSVFADLAIRF